MAEAPAQKRCEKLVRQNLRTSLSATPRLDDLVFRR